MTFGRLFGGLGGHLDDLRESLEQVRILAAGWLPQGPPGSEATWSGGGNSIP